MQSNIYRKLQERLDRLSYGYPPTKTGVELKILKRLFSEKDADVFLRLKDQPEFLKSIAGRLGRDPDVIGAQLEDMAVRGLVLRLKSGQETLYATLAFVAGIYEAQVGTMDREFAELYEQYTEEAFHRATIENLDGFLRTIPVNQAVDTMPHVAPYEDARILLKNAKKIVVAECICRKQKGLLGQACDKPRETCLLLDDYGQSFFERNMARKVPVEEALQILEQAQKAGLVTQTNSAQNPGGICNCCGDCCQALIPLNRIPKPADVVFSNYFARVETILCIACGTCLERCQMSAIDKDAEDLAVINLDRCIGCGLCVSSCPTEAISLIPKSEDERKIPPVTIIEQFALLAKKRGGV